MDKILLSDVNGNQSEISVDSKKLAEGDVEGCREFFVYCKGYLINESPYKLSIFTADKKNKKVSKLVGGQTQVYQEEVLNSNIILFGEETGDLLSLADSIHDKPSK